MAQVDSPYAARLPRAYNQGGLGSGSFYNQKFKDMGRSSKETWIKKLWSQMFSTKNKKRPLEGKSLSLPSTGNQRFSRSESRGSRGGNDRHARRTDSETPRQGRRERSRDDRKGVIMRERSLDDEPRRSRPRDRLHDNNRKPKASAGRDSSAEDNGRLKPKSSGARHSKQPGLDSRQNSNMDHSVLKQSDLDKGNLLLPPIHARSPVINQPQSNPKSAGAMGKNRHGTTDDEKDFEYVAEADRSQYYPKPPDSGEPKTTHPKNKQLSRYSAEKNKPQTLQSEETKPRISLAVSSTNAQFSERKTVDRNDERNTSPMRGKPSDYRYSKSRTLPSEDTVIVKSADTAGKREVKSTGNRYEKQLKKIHSIYDNSLYMKTAAKPKAAMSFPHISDRETETFRPRRTAAMVETEKKAKELVEDALKHGKVFTCEAPFPLDVYVRISLRKRGWVEKFGSKRNSCSSGNTNTTKIDTETEEDFEAIVGQQVPPPWEEDNGLYAIMSRLVRHCPPKFIWGSKLVNTMVLRSEVIVNHFTKASAFSSKTGLSTSVRDLAWINSADFMSFFPRAYVLCTDEEDDVVEDFRLTMCMGLLKWVIKMYVTQWQRKKFTAMLTKDNSKYEEVTFGMNDSSSRNRNVPQTPARKPDQTPAKAPAAMQDSSEDDSDSGDDSEEEGEEDVKGSKPQNGQGKMAGQGKNRKPDEESLDMREFTEYQSGDDINDDDHGDKSGKKKKTDVPKRKDGDDDDDDLILPSICLPDIVFRDKKLKKKGGEVPLKSVEWAIFYLDKFIKHKRHEDLDSKNKALTAAQWSQLSQWYHQIAYEGAHVPHMTEARLKESDRVLKDMKALWPQFETDGKRNIWIIKPGNKSKGIGIEFTHSLDDLQRYIQNSTMSGCYVMQKYIERPLLVHRCKFDMRQWFLVTDWAPLTVWFYKESYLRICSQEYNINSLHEAIHLSNVAVQENYFNGKRSDKLPDNNFWTSSQFVEHLEEEGRGYMWNKVVYPGMKKAIINILLATQDVTETRKAGFELYGADFILAEDLRPFLLEVNSSPGMAPSSLDKARLCAQVIEDTIKVVLDKKQGKGSRGNFELIYKESVSAEHKCVDTKFLIEGQRIKRAELVKYTQIDQEEAKRQKERESKPKTPHANKQNRTATEDEESDMDTESDSSVDWETESQTVVSGNETPSNRKRETPVQKHNPPHPPRQHSPKHLSKHSLRVPSAAVYGNTNHLPHMQQLMKHGHHKLSHGQKRSAKKRETRIKEKEKIYASMVTAKFIMN